jgi:RNA polymerase subunit RPABC4/transcription elongation factor Spt4
MKAPRREIVELWPRAGGAAGDPDSPRGGLPGFRRRACVRCCLLRRLCPAAGRGKTFRSHWGMVVLIHRDKEGFDIADRQEARALLEALGI